ncbi:MULTISPECIES: hypothetical protein [Peribacillus]|uniref:hypothetical protein n=1 Tax=Peribacillus TaxID=2675229 RepID=UPI001F4D80DE|nr:MULTISPECIES: hypothetical protein [unclassified Peribacillus]MCK1982420.1 hypothetical protein [Peribacillus sp. Aquil_B1]MCK2009411.1 hypothetical protein [Peribacillus sp. Aquil_B8]
MNITMKCSHSTEPVGFTTMISITVTIISKFSTRVEAGAKGMAAEKDKAENK